MTAAELAAVELAELRAAAAVDAAAAAASALGAGLYLPPVFPRGVADVGVGIWCLG